ncbi:MAG: hypothetical protein B7X48_13530 [Acidiphilium sp. 34-60-192]|nr:MAG: hypothetical protein B7X48_13530 [Acidiphilium sp. 34-60-192]
MVLTEPSRGREAERRQLTVLFCDLVESTRIATTLDPEDMSDLLDRFFQACTSAIVNFGGVVGNYVGDGLLAYFGYPIANEDDAERSVRAARAIVESVGRLRTPAGDVLQVRIGIATGLVLASGARDLDRPERGVVGETLNLASRLQAAAEPGEIVVSDPTRRLLGKMFGLRALAAQSLKGFAAPVSAWVVESEDMAMLRFASRLRGHRVMVGRDAELTRLQSDLDAAWRGTGRTLLVTGEAGIGKSRLVAALADRQRSVGHLRLSYQCSQYHRETALYPFLTQFRRAIGLNGDVPHDVQHQIIESALQALVPGRTDITLLFTALLGLPATLQGTPAEQHEQALKAIVETIEAASRRAPLLILFEDAHWADDSSIELLTLIAAAAENLPILILVTARPEFEPGRLNLSCDQQVTLGHLEPESIVAIIQGQVEAATHDNRAALVALSEQMTQRIVEKVDGVPLFAEEMTQLVLDANADSVLLSMDITIPATLQDSLMARLDRLGSAKLVAQMASVIGREFPRDLLMRIFDHDVTTLDAAVAQLEKAGLISSGINGDHAGLVFKHALLRDAAYESLPHARRRDIHRSIAVSLQRDFRGRAEVEPEIVARHYTEAKQYREAAEWWLKAGELRVRQVAYGEAIRHFERAINQVERLPDDDAGQMLRLNLQIAYGQALMARTGYNDGRAMAAFGRAEAIASTIGEPALRHPALHGLWLGAYMWVDIPTLDRITPLFFASAMQMPGSSDALLAETDSGMVAFLKGDFIEATRIFKSNVANCPASPDLAGGLRFGMEPGVNGLAYLGLCHWMSCDMAASDQYFDLAKARAEISGFPPALPYTQLYRAHVALAVGQITLAETIATQMIELTEAQGLEFYNAWARAICGIARGLRGDASGLLLADRARQYFASSGVVIAQMNNDGFYALAQVNSDPAAAFAISEASLRVAETTGCRMVEAGAYWVHGTILLRLDDPDPREAERLWRVGIGKARQQSARFFEVCLASSLANLLLSQGRGAEVTPIVDAALAGLADEAADLPQIIALRAIRLALPAEAHNSD